MAVLPASGFRLTTSEAFMKLPVEWIMERVSLTADVEEIAERLTMAGFEVEGKDDSSLGPVLDIKVTPNRGDGLSVLGVARELSAAYRVPLAEPNPSSLIPHPSSLNPTLVTIDAPDLCPRYAARIIRNVKIGPSPAWMQARLEAAGMRPISNIVDVTNYVMLETGQPLHAFDYDTVRGGRIVVRRARAGEMLTTLDGVERALTAEMLVIADAERPVALAGIMGGADTEMSESTTTVLLESAHFQPLSVRRTARALDISTEASYRSQRTVDPEGVVAALNRACQLLAELKSGDVDPEIVDVCPYPPAPRVLGVRSARVSAMLGFDVSAEQVVETLGWLGFKLKETPPPSPLPSTSSGQALIVEGEPGASSSLIPHPSSLDFLVPTWRPDIVREIDLVEEVGRVLGYEHIPEKLPVGQSTQGGDSAWGRFAERVREALVGAGLQEVVTHTLLAPTNLEDPGSEDRRVPIRSALSAELSGLRRSLLPGLLDALERNVKRGNAPLAFFEIGHVFNREGGDCSETILIGGALAGPMAAGAWEKRSQPLPADYYTARGLVERLADLLHTGALRFDRSEDPRLHPGRSADLYFGETYLGYIGELHPRHAADLRNRDRVIVFELLFDILQKASGAGTGFRPPSPYPAVSRDLAPRLALETPFALVEESARQTRIPFLETMRLTDVFTGPPLPEGTKSLTLSFTFRAPDRTLTDAEVNEAMTRLRSALEAECGASFAF